MGTAIATIASNPIAHESIAILQDTAKAAGK